MSFQERKRKILMLLDELGNSSVAEICKKLSISAATVRRDLQELSNEGLLLRTHGGAMKLDDLPLTSFSRKRNSNEMDKQAIGKLAVENIKNGDTIFMDCGSTVFAMCPYIKKMDNLKVITNSLPIAAELMDVPGIGINLIGGELDKGRRAVHGNMAIQHINHYHVDKAFIGVDGLSIERGLMAHSETEASITKAFCGNADQIYLLCDHSKIGKNAYISFAKISILHHLITNAGIDPSIEKKLTKQGVLVSVATPNESN